MTPKHEKLLVALLTCPSIEIAAKAAGLSKSTALRYLKESEFAAAYRDGRREMVSHALTTLQGACGEAVETLKAIAGDSSAPASSRVAAAKAILETSIRAVEIDDLAARVEQLESILKEQPTQ